MEDEEIAYYLKCARDCHALAVEGRLWCKETPFDDMCLEYANKAISRIQAQRERELRKIAGISSNVRQGRRQMRQNCRQHESGGTAEETQSCH